jgi:hypothetical protein
MPREREQPTRSCWTSEYSLRNSEGYAVIEGGIPIGYVEVVLEDGEAVHSLLVRVGNVFNHLVAFPLDSVEAVDPAAERVYVSLAPVAPDEQLSIPTLV